MSSEKKDPTREYETHFDVALTGSRGTNYEQKYNDLKAKYDELEEVHQNLIEETQKTVSTVAKNWIYNIDIVERV